MIWNLYFELRNREVVEGQQKNDVWGEKVPDNDSPNSCPFELEKGLYVLMVKYADLVRLIDSGYESFPDRALKVMKLGEVQDPDFIGRLFCS
jgi:hypothetical protein